MPDFPAPPPDIMNPPPANTAGPRSGKSASRFPLILPLLFLGLLVVWFWRETESPARAGTDSRPEAVPPRLEVASGPAWPAEASTSGKEREIAAAIRRAMDVSRPKGDVAAMPVPIPAREPGGAAPVHRGAPLERDQAAELVRLAWRVPGKRVEWRTAAAKPVVTYLEGRRLEPAAERPEPGLDRHATTARRFLRNNAKLLGAGDADRNWSLTGTTTDDLGYTQVRFTQRWRGLEVWPGALTLQTAPNGDATLMTAAYAPEPAIDPIPAIPVEQARHAAVRGAGLPGGGANAGRAELVVHAPLESPARLAWRVLVELPPVMRAEVYVDATDGSYIEQMPLLVTAGATGSGVDLNGQTRQIQLWRHSDNQYYTIDTSKAMYNPNSQPPNLANSRGVIAVLDQQNGTQPNIGGAVHIRSASASGPWDADAVSASVNLGKVYDYYLERFNRNSVDGAGGSMTGIVNLDDSNAYADFQSKTMIFGNRDKYAEALDVVAHEMTHSVIASSSQLVYRFQSGALNESFADVLGEGCEAHFNGGSPDWQLGTALSVQLRSISDPGSKIAFGTTPYPEKMSEFVNLGAEQDKGGVHINSSIVNHAFYQLAEGLPDAVGLDDALRIFYRAVTTKLNANSQFIDARLGCVQAAVELFGAGSPQALRTSEAFDFVEIFDQQPTPAPVPFPAVAASDSTLFIFPSGGATYLGRREARFGDDSAGVFLGDNGQPTPAMPFKKPAVRGDGAFGVFVRPDADAAVIDTETGEEIPYGLPGTFDSAAISADGLVQAFVLRNSEGNPDNRVYVFDQAANETKTYTVTQPLTDQTGAATSATVLFVDALDISPDGRFIYYDALNRLTLPGGGFVDNWSISFIDRQADTIQNLLPPVPGVNVGNPSFGQTRPELLTFDVVDANGVHFIYVADLAAGKLQPLATLAGGWPVLPGWPGYSGDDSAVVYTNYTFQDGQWVPFLESQPVQADGVSANGAAFPWLGGSGPTLGSIYRRGTWEGMPELTVTAPLAAAEGGASGAFVVSRGWARPQDTAFSFVLTGSATPGTDYQAIPLSGIIPTGQESVTIPVVAVDDSLFEGPEDVALTLAEGIGYILGSPLSATLEIADNDTLNFANWATGFGIGATDFQGDPDGDGLRNLLEFALGLHPREADGPDTVRIVIENDHAVLEVSRGRKSADPAVVVELSGDLATWLSGPPHTTTLTDTPLSLRVRDNSPVSEGGPRFMRLAVPEP